MNLKMKHLFGNTFNRNKTIMSMYADGLSYSEIAKKIGVTRSAVAGVVYRNRMTEPDTIKSMARKKTYR